MAGKNQVTLTFAGDTDKLDKAFARVQAEAAATGKAFDKTADHAVAASKRMETVADASDHIDTLGSKATSSLGALSSGFELLGPSGAGAAQGLMTAALATDALSGAGEAATIATDTLKGALGKAKAAFQGFSTAGKVATVSLGVIGVAALAAGAIFLAFKQHQDEVKQSVDDLSKSLNFQTGALTYNNRQTIAAKLEERGLAETADKLGISQLELTDAILKGGDALDKLVPKQVNLNKNSTEQAVLMKKLSEGTRELSSEVGKAQQQQGRMADATGNVTDAMDASTTATKNAKEALKDYREFVTDQFDPMANLVHRLEDVRSAQNDYREALRAHGPNSREASAANLRLAESIVSASGAAVDAAGKFGDKLDPALHDILVNGGLTEGQIRDIEKAFKAAKKAGEGFEGTYRANAELNIKIRGLTSIHFDSEGNPTRGRPQGRASGGSTNAGQTYMFGEAGREIGVFGSPGYVANARETMSILAGGTQPAPAQRAPVFEFKSNGGTMEDAVVAAFEKAYKQGRITVLAKGA